MAYRSRSEVLNEVFGATNTNDIINKMEVLAVTDPMTLLAKVRKSMKDYADEVARDMKDLYHDKN